MQQDKVCQWQHNSSEYGDYYDTASGQAFAFEVEGPIENHYKFCPSCGKVLEILEPEVEEEEAD